MKGLLDSSVVCTMNKTNTITIVALIGFINVVAAGPYYTDSCAPVPNQGTIILVETDPSGTVTTKKMTPEEANNCYQQMQNKKPVTPAVKETTVPVQVDIKETVELNKLTIIPAIEPTTQTPSPQIINQNYYINYPAQPSENQIYTSPSTNNQVDYNYSQYYNGYNGYNHNRWPFYNNYPKNPHNRPHKPDRPNRPNKHDGKSTVGMMPAGNNKPTTPIKPPQSGGNHKPPPKNSSGGFRPTTR